MTAINIVLTSESAHLFCDTMGSTPAGQQSQHVKCLPIPHLNAAIATRGAARALAAVHSLASSFNTLSDLRKGLAGAMRLSRDGTDPFFRSLRGDLDVFVIGFEDGPGAFALFTHDAHGYEAWKPLDIEGGILTPVIPQLELDRLTASGMQPGVGFNAIGVQANHNPKLIGGHIQETIVDANGIRTRCVGFVEPEHRPVFRPAIGNPKLPAAFAKHLEPRP